MKRGIQFKATTVAAFAGILALAVPQAAGAVTLFGSGSSAAQPYMQELFKNYSRTHKGVVFRYVADGGNAGVVDVQQHRSQFAIQTRPPLPSDSGTTWDKLFLDGLCIAVNPHNGLSNISLSELKNIFLATDTSWSQVAGSNLTSTIDPQGRNSAAGTYTFFSQAVLGEQDSGLERHSAVVRWSGRSEREPRPERDRLCRPVALGGRQRREEAHDRRCAVRRGPHQERELSAVPLHLVGDPNPRPNVQVEKFLDWVRTNKQAGTVISKSGAVPAFNKR